MVLGGSRNVKQFYECAPTGEQGFEALRRRSEAARGWGPRAGAWGFTPNENRRGRYGLSSGRHHRAAVGLPNRSEKNVGLGVYPQPKPARPARPESRMRSPRGNRAAEPLRKKA